MHGDVRCNVGIDDILPIVETIVPELLPTIQCPRSTHCEYDTKATESTKSVRSGLDPPFHFLIKPLQGLVLFWG
jgi:hypothetical protein